MQVVTQTCALDRHAYPAAEPALRDTSRQEAASQGRCHYVRRDLRVRLIAAIGTMTVSMLAAACSNSTSTQVPLASGNEGYLLDTPSVLMYMTFTEASSISVKGTVQEIVSRKIAGPGGTLERDDSFVGTRSGNQITIKSHGSGLVVGSGGVLHLAPGTISIQPVDNSPVLRFSQTTSTAFHQKAQEFEAQQGT